MSWYYPVLEWPCACLRCGRGVLQSSRVNFRRSSRVQRHPTAGLHKTTRVSEEKKELVMCPVMTSGGQNGIVDHVLLRTCPKGTPRSCHLAAEIHLAQKSQRLWGLPVRPLRCIRPDLRQRKQPLSLGEEEHGAPIASVTPVPGEPRRLGGTFREFTPATFGERHGLQYRSDRRMSLLGTWQILSSLLTHQFLGADPQ